MARFQGRRRTTGGDRVPPGQYVTDDFPVLTAGPTEFIDRDRWELVVTDGDTEARFDWNGLHELPMREVTVDIHCVTHWTKLGTAWRGVAVADLFAAAGVGDFEYALATSYGGYTTNIPVADLVDRVALVAVAYDDDEIAAIHGGPVRLLVPPLDFWKSAKWLRRIDLGDDEQLGFWETAGYHDYGDPWREQRYHGD
jgi:DMSO/TMAO reductase YedYZ molybdopterin-dependent catalytic subunit